MKLVYRVETVSREKKFKTQRSERNDEDMILDDEERSTWKGQEGKREESNIQKKLARKREEEETRVEEEN